MSRNLFSFKALRRMLRAGCVMGALAYLLSVFQVLYHGDFFCAINAPIGNDPDYEGSAQLLPALYRCQWFDLQGSQS